MSTDEAFKLGLEMVQKAGLDAQPHDVAVLAAFFVFDRRARGKEMDERFPEQGPLYAKKLILEAYASGGV